MQYSLHKLLSVNGFLKERLTIKEAIAETRCMGGAKKYFLVVTLDIENVFNFAIRPFKRITRISTLMPPLKLTDNYATTPKDKYEILATHFENIHKPDLRRTLHKIIQNFTDIYKDNL